MKLSQVDNEHSQLESIMSLRTMRRELMQVIKKTVETGSIELSHDYDYFVLEGEATQHILTALNQQILNIEIKLVQLGVELDEPADFVEPEDDAASAA